MWQTMKAEDILSTYDKEAQTFQKLRNKTLFERPWLDRFLAHAPRNAGAVRVLDLGCGTGQPIAQYLLDRRCVVTGVDGAANMVALFEQNLPKARAIHADMRGLDLGETFDAVLAWDSFFHLSPEDQIPMFEVFARHLAPGGVVMFTTGTDDGEALGQVGDSVVYHASLSPERYRELLAAQGLEVIRHIIEDPDCADHTVWLARKQNPAT